MFFKRFLKKQFITQKQNEQTYGAGDYGKKVVGIGSFECKNKFMRKIRPKEFTQWSKHIGIILHN
jgi:hypothetical protein